MLYAKVVFGLPVDVAFDYSIPQGLKESIFLGARVLVSLRNKKTVGYIAGLAHKTYIKNVKDVLGVIDREPLLSGKLLLLAKKLSEYYCCSYGEAIEAMLPPEVRRGKEVRCSAKSGIQQPALSKIPPVLLHDLSPDRRWDRYIRESRSALDAKKSVILLFSDIPTVMRAKVIFEKEQVQGLSVLFRKEKEEFKVWQDVRDKENCVVLGTRSAVFAPVKNLGLIILDREDDSVYKQEQVPHYHAREAALMRSQIEGAQLILESVSPSLQSFYLSQKKKIGYQLVKRDKPYPEIKIIDTKRRPYAERYSKELFPRIVSDAISSSLLNKEKILIFMNRRGFATYAACHNCLKALECPSCNVSLVYHFDQDLLRCHHCSFKMPPPKICPNCNAGYIKYSGFGTDKIESEVARIFPQAKIGENIIVSTSLILKEEKAGFDLVCCLGLDNAINRVDYMATEKVFSILSGLVSITGKKMFILSGYPEHYCLRSILEGKPEIFYDGELKSRSQLFFPPYRHMGLVRLRGRDADKVERSANVLFEKLMSGNKMVKTLALNPGHPHKLRGNFYWQILLSSASPQGLSRFLKNYLKDFRYSGIIITVDIDPI